MINLTLNVHLVFSSFFWGGERGEGSIPCVRIHALWLLSIKLSCTLLCKIPPTFLPSPRVHKCTRDSQPGHRRLACARCSAIYLSISISLSPFGPIARHRCCSPSGSTSITRCCLGCGTIYVCTYVPHAYDYAALHLARVFREKDEISEQANYCRDVRHLDTSTSVSALRLAANITRPRTYVYVIV